MLSANTYGAVITNGEPSTIIPTRPERSLEANLSTFSVEPKMGKKHSSAYEHFQIGAVHYSDRVKGGKLLTYAFDNIFVCNTFYIRKYNTRVGISLESEFLKCKILIPDYAANSGKRFFHNLP